MAKKAVSSYIKVKKIPTETYILKNRVKVGEKWKEKGEKITLTLEGARYFKEIHKI